MTKRSKLFILSTCAIGFCAVITPIVVMSLSKTKKPIDNEENISKKEKTDNFFPDWKVEMFDDFIVFENDKNIFNENIIAYFIQQTIKRLRVGEGQLKYDYKFNESKTILNIWVELKTKEGNIQRKKYYFSVDEL
ncbi:MHO_1590 family protein [Mycoplasma crocodyli]|uniref:Uncharacterized protein n=1 Tax=Mycoplasma crocodyli (strain ATCC 51981 / MP145) TaxID=512564 RepID=D5E686_MYCCM|nr:hypothetical protein [Mycoplasma crocodyli]ADE19837.1 hypothetical protein MCRO_0677 [Mycoplasma crocodyli MP145]